ncbi:MAG: hypothetical protein GY936_01595, partial [Ignavibacteriae bacterium]|nr:hypothetical protein [Ignavibacteriota bacterium]
MNYLFKNIILAVILFAAILSCDDPIPTELTNEKDEVEIDVINPEPNAIVITGYDSTGITNAVPEKQSVISLSGIKTTINGRTFYKGYGEAVFYDTSKPVLINQDRLIGYKTLIFGRIKVGNDTAKIVPHFLKYRENFVIKDTLVGVKHVIKYRTALTPSGNLVPYDENIKIEFRNLEGSPTSLTAKLPEEIIGKINVTGARAQNNLTIGVSWNQSLTGEDEIVFGGILSGGVELIPLFRISRFRNNSFVIPNSFIKDILD